MARSGWLNEPVFGSSEERKPKVGWSFSGSFHFSFPEKLQETWWFPFGFSLNANKENTLQKVTRPLPRGEEKEVLCELLHLVDQAFLLLCELSCATDKVH